MNNSDTDLQIVLSVWTGPEIPVSLALPTNGVTQRVVISCSDTALDLKVNQEKATLQLNNNLKLTSNIYFGAVILPTGRMNRAQK